MSYLCSAAFQQHFEEFYADHSQSFRLSESEEQSHDNFELFEQFKTMVEQRITTFLRSRKISEAAFVSRSRKAMEAAQHGGENKVSDSNQAWSHVLEQVIAGTEYSSFCELMQAQAQAADAKASHK